jgi:hypothetical protein
LYVKEADSSREVAVGLGEYSSVIAVQSGERETPSWYFEYEIGTEFTEGKGAT